MHIGFRYHVASLVAIFFSLGLGMLVGSTLFQDDRLVKEQGYIIADLESRFRAAESRMQALQADLNLYHRRQQVTQAGWDSLIPHMVTGSLHSRRVVLASFKEEMDWSRWEELIQLAGGELLTSLKLDEDFHQWPTELLAEESLEDEQLALVVWLDEKLPSSIGERMNEFAAAGWLVCYLQPVSNDYTLGNMGENTLVIDIADTPIGELSFVAGLAQGITGNYGIKRGATALYPTLHWLEESNDLNMLDSRI